MEPSSRRGVHSVKLILVSTAFGWIANAVMGDGLQAKDSRIKSNLNEQHDYNRLSSPTCLSVYAVPFIFSTHQVLISLLVLVILTLLDFITLLNFSIS